MTRITYVEADGRSKTIDLQEGWSLLQGAHAHAVDGILGECGGAATCGTCHCYVDEARAGDLPPPTEHELEMLGFVAAERKPNSRLACQLKAAPALEGLVVHLPATQV